MRKQKFYQLIGVAAFCLLISVIWTVHLASSVENQDVVKKNLFIIKSTNKMPVEITIGDVIQVETVMLPLIPENLGKTFEFEYDKSKLRLLAATPPSGEGTMGKEIYFKAEEVGSASVKTFLLDEEGKIIESYEYTIIIKLESEDP